MQYAGEQGAAFTMHIEIRLACLGGGLSLSPSFVHGCSVKDGYSALAWRFLIGPSGQPGMDARCRQAFPYFDWVRRSVLGFMV